MMDIEYRINVPLSVEQFIDVMRRSSLSKRRPVEDRECMKGMLDNSNLIVSAWDAGKIVGIARSMTDYHYACYMSDLAVDKEYQGAGVGKRLQMVTREQLGPKCKLILVSAPGANSYYKHLGYENNLRCWILDPEKRTDSQ